MAVRRSAYCACVALLAGLAAAPGARAAPVLVLGHDGRVSVHHDRLGTLADPAPAPVSVPRVLTAGPR